MCRENRPFARTDKITVNNVVLSMRMHRLMYVFFALLCVVPFASVEARNVRSDNFSSSSSLPNINAKNALVPIVGGPHIPLPTNSAQESMLVPVVEKDNITIFDAFGEPKISKTEGGEIIILAPISSASDVTSTADSEQEPANDNEEASIDDVQAIEEPKNVVDLEDEPIESVSTEYMDLQLEDLMKIQVAGF